MDSQSTLGQSGLNYSWEDNRKSILRAWSLVFSVLATLMVLSVADGRMAYMQGSYTGYMGIWIDCRKHQCVSLGQITVLNHMSMGFMMLALILYLILLPTMGLSFRPVFRRLSKIDLVFSLLSFSTGLLTVLSLTLFVVNCEILQPRPQVSYLVTTYLCWGSGALMLWVGVLSYLNHAGMWSQKTVSLEWQLSYRRWTLRQNSLKIMSEQHLDIDPQGHRGLSQFPQPSRVPTEAIASQDTNL